MRVVAALSGGVDSSVAAARAVDAGHEVVGIHLALSRSPQSFRSGARGCCTLEDARDARRAADVVGIPFYVWDLSEQFEHDVIDDFVAEYERGHTPNPCIRCNEQIKFEAVLDRAMSLGFDALCTGHYARLVDTPRGRELHRAVDHAKDQSYVLGGLSDAQLRASMFPVGDTPKDQIRREAAERGLLVADKPDSHDLCFVSDGNTAGYLRERLGSRPGSIVDTAGVELGTHDGAYAFTIGQRKGLSLSATGGSPRYVLSIEPASGTVTVGTREDLLVAVINADRLRWCGRRDAADVFEAAVQVRAHGAVHAARLHVAGDEAIATLEVPSTGVAPGQTMVIYDGSRVVGAATVTTTASARIGAGRT
jgi:tRNA-uridine 2-sulfurtransferase